MGSLCCCPCSDEFEESSNPNCICLRFYLHQLFRGCSTIYHRIEGRSPIQGPSYVVSSSSDSSSTDTVSSSVPYDTDERYSCLQHDGLFSRRDKSMNDDSHTLRRNMSSSGVESSGYGKKWNGVEIERTLPTKLAYKLVNMQPNSDEEDVCPTCLDEYTPENPKITTQCSHNFHLGCIYEWLERSESCPICGKEMEFCETP